MSSYTGQEIDNLVKDLSPALTTAANYVSQIGDYIVETSVADSYYYRKWNSGYCDCIITYYAGTINSNGSSGIGNDIYKVTVPLPSGLFTQVHSVVFTGQVTSALAMTGTIVSAPTTTSVQCGVIGPGTSYPVTVFLIVKGKWK